MFSYLFISLILLKFDYVLCITNCHNLITCGNCISFSQEHCVWCAKENQESYRCQPINFLEENTSWCNGSVNDPLLDYNVLKNNSFSSGENGTKVVQVLPQNVKVTIRPGEKFYFSMSYKPAKDYPLDVYYLMDNSYTMRNYKKQLQAQGLQIYEELTKLTNNVQMGIGSFVEKPALPFAGPTSNAYSFKNHLSLTHNTTLFENVLTLFESESNSSNYDDPEAGLDALMQVMVCQKELGWREKGRRIIVLATDSTYHSAGDGKFVGAFRPHDMKCHLQNNSYDMSLFYDYPSVGQINKISYENNFKIIFAASSVVEEVYEGLTRKIRGAKYVRLENVSNLIAIIKNEYIELINSVDIAAEMPAHIEIKTKPDCRVKGDCVLKHNEIFTMNVTLTPKWCPDNNMAYEVKLGPLALDEKLTVSVLTNCQCECEQNVQMTDVDSAKCSGNGRYQCGICKCDENKYGDNCACEGASTSSKDLDKCKMKSNDTSYCNGRGTCSCGKCVDCQKGFSGDFCQFDDNACLRPGDRLCSGMGRCRYGKCECVPNRSGPGCECPINNDGCYAPRSKELCSGNGECICGECFCLPTEDKNSTCSGRFCDSCDQFAMKRCLELEDYAECYVTSNNTECDVTRNQTSSIAIKIVDLLEEPKQEQLTKQCRKQYGNGSALIFQYFYPASSPNTLNIVVQKNLEKPGEVNLLLAVGIPFGLLILIGLITIVVWKILVDIHDAREYKNFAEKAAASGFTVPTNNPLYQPPIVNTNNPSFVGQLVT